MNKSLRKRFKITGTGKIMRRKMAQDHFRAKKTGKQIRGKRKGLSLSKVDARVFRKQF
ncbi:MAG: 50S ribosomal protein L35 [Candidatus Harrisonbacteria bacterium]|nr:50S ribosomal protein L35 [Candidatus Harrisonbacteria bacterium]